MLCRLSPLLSGLALTAAVLVPPSFAAAKAPSLNENAKELITEIACPGCYFPKKVGENEFIWVEGVENSLVLNFSVGHASDKLYVNDVPIFPFTGEFPPPIHAYQIRSNEPATSSHSDDRLPLELGVEMAFRSRDDGVVAGHLGIMALNKVLVTGLDSTELVLTGAPETGTLAIKSLELRPTTRAGASPTEQEKAGAAKECATFPLLCKWKAIIAAKFHEAKGALRKGCMGKRPHKAHKNHKKPEAVAASEPEKPHRVEHEHPHHDYHKVHRTTFGKVLHVLRKVVVHVLVPVMFGIVAGMTGSLIGMVVGHFCVLVFRLLFRRGAKYQRVEQDEEEAACKECEEESELLAEADLPVYEEVCGEYVVPVEKE